MIDLVILGAGGFAREASLLVEEINESRDSGNRINLLGFIEKDDSRKNSNLRSYPILGDLGELIKISPNVRLICVIADPSMKKKIVFSKEVEGREFINLIHPDVKLADEVTIGSGVLINKGVIITTNISIGNHVSINPACGLGHDVVIEDYATLMWRVSLSGAVNIGEGSLIGTGATILQYLKVGKWSKVGAGAVVIKDVPGYSTAVGVPARIIDQAKEVF